jgi:predicted amidohydrolase
MATTHATWRIGLAAVRNAPTVAERLETLQRMLAEAAARQVAIVCFPETYIPGLRGQDFPVPPPDQRRQTEALATIGAAARKLGYQTKNQIPPEEAPYFVAGDRRRLFEVDGVPFGVTICHEGWRYPESVRWAAARGARIVFHPQLTGSDQRGCVPKRWGDPDAPYYEKAMLARAIENSIYFASVNYAFRYQESATSLIGPDGELLAHVPYGDEALLVYDLDLSRASGFYARRLNTAQYA